MSAVTLTDRHTANLHGMLSCFDRMIVTDTLPGACFAGGMTSFLYAHDIRIFDYPRFAEPLRERIRERAQEVCADAGIEIEHVNKSHIRKEELVARVLAVRGDAPGLVHVISAMEGCPSYKPWHDKASGKTFLRAEVGKCLHYYFYFIDEEFGLCYLRVPTWAPFGLQFYCNGHSALAIALKREGIDFVQEDNAFLRVADLKRAQALADSFNPEKLHHRLTRYAHWLCPVADVFGQDDWHWSIRQAEYSTDLMFRSREILVPLYDAISRQAVLAADAPRVAGFLGKKVTPTLAQEIGSRLSTRIEGRCIKHYMGAAGVKVYDKFSGVLGVETTADDVSFLTDAAHLAFCHVAPAQTPAHARTDEEGHAYLSLLPHSTRPRSHRSSLFAHTLQYRSGHGSYALKSPHDLSKLSCLGNNACSNRGHSDGSAERRKAPTWPMARMPTSAGDSTCSTAGALGNAASSLRVHSSVIAASSVKLNA